MVAKHNNHTLTDYVKKSLPNVIFISSKRWEISHQTNKNHHSNIVASYTQPVINRNKRKIQLCNIFPAAAKAASSFTLMRIWNRFGSHKISRIIHSSSAEFCKTWFRDTVRGTQFHWLCCSKLLYYWVLQGSTENSWELEEGLLSFYWEYTEQTKSQLLRVLRAYLEVT